MDAIKLNSVASDYYNALGKKNKQGAMLEE